MVVPVTSDHVVYISRGVNVRTPMPSLLAIDERMKMSFGASCRDFQLADGSYRTLPNGPRERNGRVSESALPPSPRYSGYLEHASAARHR